MIKFNKIYFLLATFLLLMEILIACYIHTGFVRAYGGDFLVVILIYCFVRSFLNSQVLATAAWVLIFAYGVEISQYFHLVILLGLQHSKTATLILGTTFSMVDMIVYTLGILLVIVLENI